MMSQLFQIERKSQDAPLMRQRWLDCINARNDLTRPAPKPGRNPVTGEPILLHPANDCATLVVDDSCVATLHWSQSEGDQSVLAECIVNDSESTIAILNDIAKELDSVLTHIGYDDIESAQGEQSLWAAVKQRMFG